VLLVPMEKLGAGFKDLPRLVNGTAGFKPVTLAVEGKSGRSWPLKNQLIVSR
jgi:hypothetical protein